MKYLAGIINLFRQRGYICKFLPTGKNQFIKIHMEKENVPYIISLVCGIYCYCNKYPNNDYKIDLKDYEEYEDFEVGIMSNQKDGINRIKKFVTVGNFFEIIDAVESLNNERIKECTDMDF